MAQLNFSLSRFQRLFWKLSFLLACCLCLSANAFARTPRAARNAGCKCKPVSASRVEALHPVTQKNLNAAMRDLKRRGLRPRLTTTFRSHTEQRSLFSCYHKRRCRARRGIYDAARPGTSLHEAGLAVDVAGVAAGNRRQRRMTRDGKKIVRVMQRHGFNWPHGLRDPVHFEISPRRAGYRSSHAAIRAGQQRWVALNRTACAVRTKGQRVAGGKQKSPDKITLQKVAYHRPPTRRR